MDNINVWDIWHVYDKKSMFHLDKWTVIATRPWISYILVQLEWWHKLWMHEFDFVKSELYNNTKQPIMTTTAKVIQERIVKKYLTNKKLDELTKMIEEIRLIVDNKKWAMKLLQDDLKTLEDIDIEINLAIDNLDIDYIKTLEKRYCDWLTGN